MDFIDYREKLGIGLNDIELEQLFFRRIFNELEGFYPMYNQISGMEYVNFCQKTGCIIKHSLCTGEYWSEVLKILHDKSNSITEFLSYYIFLIEGQEDNNYKTLTKNDFKDLLCKCLNESHIPFEVYEEDGTFFVFPKGAKELDDALVSEPLLWLKDYPNTRKAWIDALKGYSKLTNDAASDVADKFRKSLERFFQEFFKSDKSLENLKSDYGNYLSSKGVPAEIRNVFEKLLDLYTKYMNDNAKHHDKVGINVLEFIMYQTGNIMRLMITISKEN